MEVKLQKFFTSSVSLNRCELLISGSKKNYERWARKWKRYERGLKGKEKKRKNNSRVFFILNRRYTPWSRVRNDSALRQSCDSCHWWNESLLLRAPHTKCEGRDLSFAMFHVRNHCSDYVRYHQQLVGNVNFGSYRYKFNFIRFSQKGFISQTLVRYIKYRRIYFKHSSILLPQKRGWVGLLNTSILVRL